MRLLALKRRRDLRRRRWQFGAVGLTVFLGVMLFALSYDAYRNLVVSYQGTYERLRFADMTVTGVGPGFASEVASVDGVAAVEQRVQADIPLRVEPDRSFIGRVVSVPPDTQPSVNALDIVDGTLVREAEPAGVVVETRMAEYWELGAGDTVEYFDGQAWIEVEILGEGISPEYLWRARDAHDILPAADSFGVLFVSEALIEGLPEPLHDEQVLVLYEPDADSDSLDSTISSLAHDAGALSVVSQADHPSNKALSLDLLAFEQMAYAFPVMFLLAAGMAAYTLLNRLVYSERVIIGTLRANGLTRRAVVRHYLAYGLLLGGGAALLGIAAGIPLGWVTTYAYTEELGLPDTIRELRWITPVAGLVFGLVAGLISAWAPARSASRLDPADAMRGEVAADGARRSLFEIVAPPLKRAPVRVRMVLRGLSRNPRRSLSTVFGVILALTLILSAWGLIDTVVYLLDKQFGQIQLRDSTVHFQRPLTADDLDAVEAVEGVQSAELVHAPVGSVRSATDSYRTQLFAFPADTEMHSFGELELPSAEEVILGEALRDELGVEAGDRVDVVLPGLDAEIEVTVAAFVDEVLGTFAYMSDGALVDALSRELPAEQVRERLSDPDTSVLMARYEPEADRDAVNAAIRGLDGVAALSDERELFETVEEFMGLFYLFVGLMLVFGGAMAFALLFNTMTVNLAERAGELAGMHANGVSHRKVAMMVVEENTLLTAIGVAPGLVVGHVAAAALMASYSTDLLAFELHMQPMTYVWAALAVFVVTALSLIPGLRAIKRVDIGAVVRQRNL